MPPEVQRRTLGLAGYDVPVVELTGAADGPRLTVLAGVHGCEYAPMAAVRRWTRALAQRELRGTVRAVPVLNLPCARASRSPRGSCSGPSAPSTARRCCRRSRRLRPAFPCSSPAHRRWPRTACCWEIG